VGSLRYQPGWALCGCRIARWRGGNLQYGGVELGPLDAAHAAESDAASNLVISPDSETVAYNERWEELNSLRGHRCAMKGRSGFQAPERSE